MSVIVLNDLVEEWSKNSVRIVTSRVNTNSGIDVFASRENGVLEIKTKFIFLSFATVEDFFGEVLAKKRFGTFWEDWHTSELFGTFKVRSNVDTVCGGRWLHGALFCIISKWGFIYLEWLGVGLVVRQSALSTWASFL